MKSTRADIVKEAKQLQQVWATHRTKKYSNGDEKEAVEVRLHDLTCALIIMERRWRTANPSEPKVLDFGEGKEST